ncbi:ArsA-related P-loop ATPase [Thermodesulfatator indicus]
MKVQKFRAKTSMEALAKVKEALGEEAVILSTRRVRENGRWLYEITAAIDFEPEEQEVKTSSEKENISFLMREIASLKEMILGLESSLKPRSTWADLFIEQGVPAKVIKLLSRNGNGNKELFLKNVAARVKERVGPTKLSKFLFFIGQAGVGKTTSVIKLAARLSAAGHRVAIVSLDIVRVGAREQISRFAELLELPLYFSHPEDFPVEAENFEKFDYVLIDTPALGAGFPEFKLKNFLSTKNVSFHLVIRASDVALMLPSLFRRLKGFPITSLILTHVESLPSGGILFGLFLPETPPVSFISTGEQVPEDFERITPKRLFGLLMRNLELEERHARL